MNKKTDGSVSPETSFQDTSFRQDSDATLRVRLDGTPVTPASHRVASGQRNVSSGSSRTWKRKSARKRKQMQTIGIIAAAALLLLGILAGLIIHLSQPPKDDGLILSNVYAAGVNLGGKTPAQAKTAILAATSDTYTKLPMVVTVHDTVVELSPKDTKAELDVDALVTAAYNYGRTGSRAEQEKAKNQAADYSYHLSILPYLGLDTEYIKQVVDGLGEQYSSTLSQPSYTVQGTRPDLNVGTENVDCEKVHQTLELIVGTPEYGLDTQKLYDQIIEAYNINIFQVSAEITVVTPDTLNLEEVFHEFCVEPVDAQLDDMTFEVTPEVYGYGFSLSEAAELLQNASYGEKITLELKFIRPDFTANELAGDLFTDIIASSVTTLPKDKAAQVNIILAARELNGMILKSNQEFSFNAKLGRPTEASGYKSAEVFVGKELQKIVGGGVSQVASALYYCALASDMEITSRSPHVYAPKFINPGLDADILFGSKDLCFRNTSVRPIRIDIEVTNSNQLKVNFVGTKNQEQTVEVLYETVKTYEPTTLVTVMPLGASPDHSDGEVLVEGITGCDINIYRVYSNVSTPGDVPVKKLVSSDHYEKRNEVVISEQELTEPPTEPSTDPTAEPSTDPTAEPSTAPTAEPSTDPTTETPTEPSTPPVSTTPTQPSDTNPS